MKIGIIIYSSGVETVWNAFRHGVFSLTQGDTCSAFLLAKSVVSKSLHADRFPVRTQMQAFVDADGISLACDTCLKLGKSEGTEFCPPSTMQDLYEMIRGADKVVSCLECNFVLRSRGTLHEPGFIPLLAPSISTLTVSGGLLFAHEPSTTLESRLSNQGATGRELVSAPS